MRALASVGSHLGDDDGGIRRVSLTALHFRAQKSAEREYDPQVRDASALRSAGARLFVFRVCRGDRGRGVHVSGPRRRERHRRPDGHRRIRDRGKRRRRPWRAAAAPAVAGASGAAGTVAGTGGAGGGRGGSATAGTGGAAGNGGSAAGSGGTAAGGGGGARPEPAAAPRGARRLRRRRGRHRPGRRPPSRSRAPGTACRRRARTSPTRGRLREVEDRPRHQRRRRRLPARAPAELVGRRGQLDRSRKGSPTACCCPCTPTTRPTFDKLWKYSSSSSTATA